LRFREHPSPGHRQASAWIFIPEGWQIPCENDVSRSSWQQRSDASSLYYLAVDFFAAAIRMLSTRFGWRRPALRACAFAVDFCPDERCFDVLPRVLRGFCRFQGGRDDFAMAFPIFVFNDR